jgi:two-component system cell cycle sensor histidine kinase/response regulator CckA
VGASKVHGQDRPSSSEAPGPDRLVEQALRSEGFTSSDSRAPYAAPPEPSIRRNVPVVELALFTTWAGLSAACAYILADETRHTFTLVAAAVLYGGLSALLVLSLVAVRRAVAREVREQVDEASSGLQAMALVTDPALSSLPLDELLDEVLGRARAAVRADVCVLYLLDEDERSMKVRARQGAEVDEPTGAPAGRDDLVDLTATWGRPARSGSAPSVSRHEPILSLAAGPTREAPSAESVPLVASGALIGMLEVVVPVGHSLDEAEVQLLRVAADRCASALERARLEEVNRRSRLAAEHAQLHLGVLARGGTVLGRVLESYDAALTTLGDVVVPDFADWFSADVLDEKGEIRRITARSSEGMLASGGTAGWPPHRHPKGDRYVRLAIAQQRPHVVAKHRHAAFIEAGAAVHSDRPPSEDEREQPDGLGGGVESMIVVPVKVSGRYTGALSFVTGPGRRGYRPSDLQTALGLADRVGVAIERVTSWRSSLAAEREAVRYAARLKSLVEAALFVNAPLAEEEVLELLAEHARVVLEADVVVVTGPPGGRPLVEVAAPSAVVGLALRAPGEAEETSDLQAVVKTATELVAASGRACRRPEGAFSSSGPSASRRVTLWNGIRPLARLNGWLAAPLTGADGECRRVIVALGAEDGGFSSEDESVLILLSRMASVSMQNAHLYEAVRGNELRLEAVVDSSPLAIAELDITGGARWWNKAAASLFGWDAERGARRVPLGEGSDLVLAGLWEQARDGKPSVGIPLASKKPSGEALELSVSTAPLSDHGHVTGMLVVAEDVTERRKLLERFHQAERLGAMSRLAGAVAHDFNNLLTVILSCSEVLSRQSDDAIVVEEVAAIQRAGERAAALTKRLVGIGSQRPLQPEVVTLDEAVHSMEPMLAGVLGEHVELEVLPEARGSKVLVDRSDLERSLLNLAVNAKDAMPTGGRCIVRTGRPKRLGQHGLVRVTVSDTGVGMDADTLAHCLEPFFTTKGRAHGTGLGLATVNAAVTAAGGELRVESAPGSGTSITMSFPAYEESGSNRAGKPALRAVAVEHPQPEGAGEGEVVLLVDDEPELLRLAARELEVKGYEVFACPGGTQALSTLQSRHGEIDLLVTDVVMPGMNGIELADAVRRRYPAVPVLYVSGHLDEDTVGRRTLPRESELLAKPFTPDELARRVRRAIDASVEERSGKPAVRLQGSNR